MLVFVHDITEHLTYEVPVLDIVKLWELLNETAV
jgi:hypothetical protein